MILGQNPFKILTEAMKSETCEIDCTDDQLDDSLVQGDFDDIYDDTEELEDDIDYSEDMVNVIQQETASGSRYLVEMDNLAKYMQSSNITDVLEAITKIAECNSLDATAMCVVIESSESARQMLEEAKKFKKSDPTKSLVQGIKDSFDVIKLMKTKGIKVVKKKARGKKGKK